MNKEAKIVKCPLCGGNGVIETICHECNGLYYYEWGSEWIRCSYYLCKRGKVEEPCPECGGEGYIIEED